MRTKAWKRVGPAIYMPAAVEETPALKLRAAQMRLPREAAFSGYTAAWLFGLDAVLREPIEVTIPAPTTVSSRSGMVVRRRALGPNDFAEMGGHRVTSIQRTLRDLSRRLSLTETVVLIDTALHMRLTKLADLRAAPDLTKVVEHAEPLTESPMETRLRMLLVLRGVPRPEAQVAIRDRWGRLLGRIDLYYPKQRLALEYDGQIHEGSLAADDRRQNRLVRAGIRLLRFTGADVLGSPDAVAAAVRAELARP